MMGILEALGQRQDRAQYGGASGDYHREHKPAPSGHTDFAWPGKGTAIDARGGVHTKGFIAEHDTVQEENRRQIDRARAVGWEVMILRGETRQ